MAYGEQELYPQADRIPGDDSLSDLALCGSRNIRVTGRAAGVYGLGQRPNGQKSSRANGLQAIESPDKTCNSGALQKGGVPLGTPQVHCSKLVPFAPGPGTEVGVN